MPKHKELTSTDLSHTGRYVGVRWPFFFGGGGVGITGKLLSDILASIQDIPRSTILECYVFRFGFLDKASCLQFEVCASLSDRDYLRKVETEPTKLLVLDSEHRLWVWEPTIRGSAPSLFSGFAKCNGNLPVESHLGSGIFSIVALSEVRNSYNFDAFFLYSVALLSWKAADCCY